MNVTSIKAKLLGLAAIAILGLIALVVVNHISARYIEAVQTAESLAVRAETALMSARTNEHEFLLHKTDDHSNLAKEYLEAVQSRMESLASIAPSLAEEATEIAQQTKEHEDLFNIFITELTTLGLDENKGIQGTLRQAIHGVEERLKPLDSDRLMVHVLMLRRHEKDFIMRRDAKYMERFTKEITAMRNSVEETALAGDLKRNLQSDLTAYESSFTAYVESSLLLNTHMKALADTADNLVPLMKELGKKAEAMASARLAASDRIIFGIQLGLGLILLACSIILIRSITHPLDALQRYARQVTQGNYEEVSSKGFSGELLALHADFTHMVREFKRELGFAQGVLRGIPTPCGIVGPDFTMKWCNQQLCDLLEKKEAPEAYTGVPSGSFYWNDPKRETLSDKAIKEKRPMHNELPYISPSGRERAIDISTTPFYDMDNNMLGSVSFWYDLTVIRENEAKVRTQNERIAKAAEAASEVADQVAAASEELSAQVEESSNGAMVQRERTGEVATAVEEMNVTVMEVASNASTSAELANDARQKAQRGNDVVRQVVETITAVSSKAMELKTDMTELGKQAEGIGSIMSVINDIADQTNLLALNAAIEAARAGEAGRGFAVVADEVRKLAEKTMTATREVADYITAIQQSTTRNMRTTEETAEAIGVSNTLAQQAGDELGQIVELIDMSADQARGIATAAEQQSAAAEEISRSTMEISETASQTAMTMEEASKAVTDLARLAARLHAIISDMQD